MGFRPGVVPGQQQPGQLPGQAGGEGDDALVVLLQQLPVHAGLAVKALGEAPADQGGEVAVARLVPAEQDEMIGAVVDLMDPVEPGPGSHIDLAADDGLDALGFRVHNAMVGDGDGRLAQLFGPGHQAGDPTGPVQQAVF